ncbi:MAG: hypothetical protein EOO22_08175 [Comamonadaceae bacterium]|nr:MAG: hypothetical protein EOO22_08175 [Comamonadaceae bacterium]
MQHLILIKVQIQEFRSSGVQATDQRSAQGCELLIQRIGAAAAWLHSQIHLLTARSTRRPCKSMGRCAMLAMRRLICLVR